MVSGDGSRSVALVTIARPKWTRSRVRFSSVSKPPNDLGALVAASGFRPEASSMTLGRVYDPNGFFAGLTKPRGEGFANQAEGSVNDQLRKASDTFGSGGIGSWHS